MRRDVFHATTNFPRKSQLVLDRLFQWSEDGLLLIEVGTGRIKRANEQALELFGYTAQELLHAEIGDLLDKAKDRERIQLLCRSGVAAHNVDFEVVGRRHSGGVFVAQLNYGYLDHGLALIGFKDIFLRRQLELLQREFSDLTFLHQQYYLKMQLGRKILRMVAEQIPIEQTLNDLCRGIEALLTGIRASICVEKEGRLECLAAPNLPEQFRIDLKGTPVLKDGLPCARAVYLEEQIIAEDMLNNEAYAPFKAVIKHYNIQSCWSIPITSSIDGSVLGTFAFYSDEPYFPQHAISDLIIVAVDLAEIALKQANDRQMLLQMNQRYAEQNKELEAAKHQLEADKALLLDREEKLKEAQHQSKVGSWEWNLKTQCFIWSEQQYRTYGLRGVASEELYAAYRKCIHPADRGNFQAALAQAYPPHNSFRYEHRIVTEEGSIRYILGTGKVERDDNGTIVYVKGTEQDITALKEAQEAALQHELQFNELIANINEIVFMVNIKDHKRYTNPITYINGDTIGIFGYTHRELMENNSLWTERIHPDDLPEVVRKGEALHHSRHKITREYRFQHKDGHYLWIEDNISVGRSDQDGQNRLYGSARDVTNRKRAEQASKEIQERLELAKQAASLGNYDWKIKGDTLHWDNRMYEIYGLDPIKDRAIRKNEYIISILHPDDRERVVQQYLSNLSKDNKVYNSKNSYRIILNGKIKYIESYVIYIRDESLGKVDRAIGTCLDVTERREAEALSISNEEKAVLLKEIHHRVKNNLQVITSLLSLQSNSLRHPEQQQIFADSQYRINSMAIVHELLYQSNNLSKVNYRDYLSKLSQFLISSIKGNTDQVDLELDIENVQLNIDTAIPLGLLINEVLTNSLKYGLPREAKGRIFIRLQPTENASEDGRLMYRLDIGDNGVGYSDAINHRTTQSLGLKLIHNLTRQLEGTIIKDPVAKGTHYIITFKEA